VSYQNPRACKRGIENRILAKAEKDFRTDKQEGAAQIIAAELENSFDNEKFKIDELSPGMKKVILLEDNNSLPR